MKFERFSGNPIISPTPENEWESLVTTNPAVWKEDNGDVRMLYRAAGNDDEHKVYFGLARSTDGGKTFSREADKPVFSPSIDGQDAGCVEDPRVIKLDDWYYITYAYRPFPPGKYWVNEADRNYFPPKCPEHFPRLLRENATATGLLLTQDFKSFIRAGSLTEPTVDDRDVMIFPEKIDGKYWMIHRPMEWCGEGFENEHPGMWISSGEDLLSMRDSTFLAGGKYDWESGKIGGNTPPMKTKDGWLILHHSRGADTYYRVGAMLLDLNDPTKVLHRSEDYQMQPEDNYEFEGMYEGCIFPCGKVEIDGILHIYYGAADKYVGLATCNLNELLSYLKTCKN
ncbi:glycosidase [Vibrio hangzhouensis]|uniref:Predicted glycosyl hydrolase, GH43/DUF377 family n=1 Tax=Vibrio hangzhouensis TaxID=462991 RepID=A0A1H5TIH1_9VIBR|nr:glycosidase [Vibrio hangzhouensis]SEF62566.1 Predicted glycosyl hydrolase, GH43/DUF377 family [Vibrio hangzhouensis]